jgi:hypothetical protein
MLMACLLTVLMRPWAIESQRTMPPFCQKVKSLNTKDVDKDSSDFGIASDKFESFFDCLGSGSSTTVYY